MKASEMRGNIPFRWEVNVEGDVVGGSGYETLMLVVGVEDSGVSVSSMVGVGVT